MKADYKDAIFWSNMAKSGQNARKISWSVKWNTVANRTKRNNCART